MSGRCNTFPDAVAASLVAYTLNLIDRPGDSWDPSGMARRFEFTAHWNSNLLQQWNLFADSGQRNLLQQRAILSAGRKFRPLRL